MNRSYLRVLVLPAILCLVSVARPAAARDDTAKPSPAAAAASAAKDVAADLREARDLLKKVSDRRTRERLELLLTRAELRAGEIQQNLAALSVPAKPLPLSDDEFRRLLKSLKAESFDKGKLTFIENFVKTRHLTCGQARQMLQAFDFDTERVPAAVALYPRLTDPDNFYTVLEVFTFDTGKKAVRDKLKLK
jgi:Domain of unknown function (DUF4476)